VCNPEAARHSPSHERHLEAEASYTSARAEYWDEFAAEIDRWQGARGAFRKRLSEIYSLLVPPGKRVLDLGCATGDLLASLRPSYGVGVDFSHRMLDIARSRHPDLHFVQQEVHQLELNEQFDYIICSDLVNDLWDIQKAFERVRQHSHPGTRLLLNAYSRVWEIPRRVAEALGLAKKCTLPQNWITVEDLRTILFLAGFEVIRDGSEVLWPFGTPLVDKLCNRYLVKTIPFRWLAMTNFIVARPIPKPRPEPARVSVIVPARNESGNIRQIVDRVPEMGAGTELIFVEGNSTDDTYEAIRNEIARRPGCTAKLFRQTGKGKGDAVRLGFANATGDVLMILDADLTVPPEYLPRFYEAWYSGKGEFINGVRLVYPMEERAMRFFNLLGNKFFSLAFSWLLDQSIKDTLCGTKVLSRQDYETIAANRAYFGRLDPFGDFDVIFGAAKYSLRILDLPIRYRERTYGETNIQRWSHGWLLLRMLLLALRRIKFV
jgi:ubiquinone/menaquinone biosynthesis C-methylase UbiE